MPLTIENGSGVLNADSYGTVAECEAFAIAYWGSSLAGSPANKAAALRRAAKYMDNLKWKGRKANGRDQGLAWPREGVSDAEGIDIDDDEIPDEVKKAQFIFARVEFQSPGALVPNVIRNEAVKREKVDVIEVEYAEPSRSIDAFRPVVTQAMDMLAGLLVQDGNVKWLLRG